MQACESYFSFEEKELVKSTEKEGIAEDEVGRRGGRWNQLQEQVWLPSPGPRKSSLHGSPDLETVLESRLRRRGRCRASLRGNDDGAWVVPRPPSRPPTGPSSLAIRCFCCVGRSGVCALLYLSPGRVLLHSNSCSERKSKVCQDTFIRGFGCRAFLSVRARGSGRLPPGGEIPRRGEN